jgi:carboxyl-terminal processing protease
MSPFKRFLKNNLSSIFLFLAVFFAGWMLGIAGYDLNLKLNPPGAEIVYREIPSSTVDFSLLGDVLNQINANFLFKPVNAQELLYGSISGLVEALGDPYSSFLTPEENSEFQNELEGKYEGIGAELGIRNDQLIIVSPLEGSPAESTGVRAGDKILEIEGESTEGIDLYEAVMKIRGAAGTVSTLTLQRGDGAPFEAKITRAEITVESVRYEEMDSTGSPQEGGGIFYLRVSRFGEGTLDEWDAAVKAIENGGEPVRGVILDLRSNPGGFLNGAVYLASEFLTSGVVVIQEDADGARQSLEVQSTTNDHAFSGESVIVLVNGGSASASEILAAALREKVDAKLVGEKTFGKGTVQDVDELSGGAGLHLTVAKWLTPSGEWVNGTGLTPDYEVAITDEDLNADRDPQFDKALELLR